MTRDFLLGFVFMGLAVCGIMATLDYFESKKKLAHLEIKLFRQRLIERQKRGKL